MSAVRGEEVHMDGLRWVRGVDLPLEAPCNRCQATGCPWDRIAGKPVCPDCQEQLALGEGEPLIEKAEKHHCAICQQHGTIRYLTFPLHASEPVEIDLCPQHFHALLRRRLDRYAYMQLGRQLQGLGMAASQVFLLHEAFYDTAGRPLQPVPDPW
jgi:hypothetical protein